MRPDRDVVNSPLFNQDLNFLQGVEDFPIEQLVFELAVEARVLAVLSQNVGNNESPEVTSKNLS